MNIYEVKYTIHGMGCTAVVIAHTEGEAWTEARLSADCIRDRARLIGVAVENGEKPRIVCTEEP